MIYSHLRIVAKSLSLDIKQGYLKLIEEIPLIPIDEDSAKGKTEFWAICMRYLPNDVAVKCCTKLKSLL